MYYCANENNINTDIQKSSNYNLIKGNLCDKSLLDYILRY